MEDFLEEIDTTPAFAPISAAIRALTAALEGNNQDVRNRLHKIETACEELLNRTAPRSACAFCSVQENKDAHNSVRCSRFPDPVSRVVRAAKLALCE